MKKLIAATYAPMFKNGSLNLDLIEDYQAFLQYNKVDGAFVNGSTGDFVSLNTEERKRLLEAWAKVKSDDLYLINHVGHTNLREAKELASHSKGKADAIAALAPYYYRPKTLGQLLEYCTEIALSAPDIPFFYYHIPVLTGVNFNMVEFVEKASSAIPNFAGIKYTEDNLSGFKKTLESSAETADILFGVDEKLVASLSVGAKGWVGSTYNHLAPLYHEAIAAHKNGNLEKAEKLQKKAIMFVEILESMGGFHGGSKSFMQFFGLNMGPSRYPHQTFDRKQLIALTERFDRESITSCLSTPYSKDFLKRELK